MLLLFASDPADKQTAHINLYYSYTPTVFNELVLALIGAERMLNGTSVSVIQKGAEGSPNNHVLTILIGDTLLQLCVLRLEKHLRPPLQDSSYSIENQQLPRTLPVARRKCWNKLAS